MAKKRKTLPNDLQEIIDSRDLDRFQAVFEKCELSATNRGMTAENVFSYKRLTLDQVRFLCENGMDLNWNAGFGRTPAAYLAHDLEILKYLVDHGARLNDAVDELHGNALFYCACSFKAQAVENLLACGAAPEPRGGFDHNTALDEALHGCNNVCLPNMVRIAKALLAAGAQPSEKTKIYVKALGEKFEFHRGNINPDFVNEWRAALDELYKLFHVDPVSRRAVYDGKSPITVGGDTWQKQFTELWNLLVPGNSHANTIQGEVIRVIGKISNELLDNGGGNWDEEYRKMAAALPTYFQTFGGETAEKACQLAKKISGQSEKELLYPLAELSVRWVLENNQPAPLTSVNYKR